MVSALASTADRRGFVGINGRNRVRCIRRAASPFAARCERNGLPPLPARNGATCRVARGSDRQRGTTLQTQFEHTAPPRAVTKAVAPRPAVAETRPFSANDLVRLSARRDFLCADAASMRRVAGAGPPPRGRRFDRHLSVRLQNRNALSIRKTYGTVRQTLARIQ